MALRQSVAGILRSRILFIYGTCAKHGYSSYTRGCCNVEQVAGRAGKIPKILFKCGFNDCIYRFSVKRNVNCHEQRCNSFTFGSPMGRDRTDLFRVWTRYRNTNDLCHECVDSHFFGKIRQVVPVEYFWNNMYDNLVSGRVAVRALRSCHCLYRVHIYFNRSMFVVCR